MSSLAHIVVLALLQVNAADTLTASDFDANGAPADPNTFAPGDLVARYVYDGLGRLIVRQVPLSRGIPDAWTPYVQTEQYYYDGVRRIQTVIERDPNELVLVAAATFEPAFLGVPASETLEYVWGPDYVDELVCQYDDPNGNPFWALTDANYNVMAIVDAECEVVEQYVYDPYGGLLAVETLDPNATLLNRVAHQGLFFERFADDILTPPLAVGAPGVYENRNRKYEPYLSRFLQMDVNDSAQPILSALSSNGDALAAFLGAFETVSHYGDGINLYAYGDSNPVAGRDPLGLYDEYDEIMDDLMGHRVAAIGLLHEGARWASLGMDTAVTLAAGLLPGAGLYQAYKSGVAIVDGEAGFWDYIAVAAVGLGPTAYIARKAFGWAKRLYLGKVNQEATTLSRATQAARAVMCFSSGTMVLMADGSLIPIEDVDVGSYVQSNVDPHAVGHSVSIAPEEWCIYHLQMVDSTGGTSAIALLRPKMHRPDDSIGDETREPCFVWLSLPDLGIHGSASIDRIEPCPPHLAGSIDGVVTATIRRKTPFRLDVHVEFSVESSEQTGTQTTTVISTTTTHPFWSVNRRDWVEAGDLMVGEMLGTWGRHVTVTAIVPQPDVDTVFNIEVTPEHTYFVSPAMVWVHNTCTKAQVRDLAKYWKLEGPKNHPKLGARSRGQEWFTDGSKWYTFDIDGHRGGMWKVFDRKGNRLHTVDHDGNIVGP